MEGQGPVWNVPPTERVDSIEKKIPVAVEGWSEGCQKDNSDGNTSTDLD